MALYIKFAEKRIEDREFVRFTTAFSIFNVIFSFLNKEKTYLTFFDESPIPSLSEKIENYEFEVGLIEKLRKSINSTSGFEIRFKTNVRDDGQILFVFTLLPNKYAFRHDVLLEIRSNGLIKKFMDIEKYIPNFRNELNDKIKRFNELKKKEILKIDRAIISVDGKDLHSFNDYHFFYSRNPENLLIEHFFLSKILRKHLLMGNKSKFAKELVDNDSFAILIDSLAQRNAVGLVAGSISVIPSSPKNMNEFSSELIAKLERIAEKFPTKDELTQEIEKVAKDTT
jgi:hypothetical protein